MIRIANWKGVKSPLEYPLKETPKIYAGRIIIFFVIVLLNLGLLGLVLFIVFFPQAQIQFDKQMKVLVQKEESHKAIEARLNEWESNIARKEENLASQETSLNAKIVYLVDAAKAALAQSEGHLNTKAEAITRRENDLIEREAIIAQKEKELAARITEVDKREKSLADLEGKTTESRAADDVRAAQMALSKAEKAKASIHSPVFYDKVQELLGEALEAMVKGDYAAASTKANGAAILAGFAINEASQGPAKAADDVAAARVALSKAEDAGASAYTEELYTTASLRLDSAVEALNKEDFEAASKNAKDSALLANIALSWKPVIEGRAADDVIAARVALDRARMKEADKTSPAAFKMAERSLERAIAALEARDYRSASSEAINTAIIANALAGRM
jgi:hypothetical protein